MTMAADNQRGIRKILTKKRDEIDQWRRVENGSGVDDKRVMTVAT